MFRIDLNAQKYHELKGNIYGRQLNLQGSAWFHSQPGKIVSNMDGCGVFGEENTIDDFRQGKEQAVPHFMVK